MNTTVTIGNDANLGAAIMYADFLLSTLRGIREDNAAGHYALANARLSAVRATIPALIQHIDTVHDDLVWRV